MFEAMQVAAAQRPFTAVDGLVRRSAPAPGSRRSIRTAACRRSGRTWRPTTRPGAR
ncbi:hypothetical protein ACFPM0_09465 [Pseudonocardia sulfidoxydans]|uniref:hypothetical protein n=1 Tax=Pseudonocardia sulfidoxydans TaxID=54011 RepID=UPI0036136E9F